MGRGQLKYKKRGGRGHGGPSSGGRGRAGRGGRGTGNAAPDDAPASPDRNYKADRTGGRGRHHGTSHLPSNTERWGLSFGEGDHNQGQQGRRMGPAPASASSSAVGNSFQARETERLLDESEWATGASSWRLGAATAAAQEEHQTEGAAAAPSELLSLNLDMLEKCLRKSSVHERLRLPHTYTAELEVDIREDPALEPAILSPTRTRGGTQTATPGRVGGSRGGGGGTVEQAVTEVGEATNARGGGARVGGDGGGGRATPNVEGDEDGVLDALLGLPAAGAGGAPSRAGEPGLAASSAGRAALKASFSSNSLSSGDVTTPRHASSSEHGHGHGHGHGHVHEDGRGEGGAPTEPAGAARSRDHGGAAADPVRVGGFGTDVGVGGAAGGGADELEDWLDDMLAEA